VKAAHYFFITICAASGSGGMEVKMQRRRHSAEYKQQVIKEVIETGNAAAVARKHDLSPSMVSRWVRESKNGSPMKEMISQGLKSNKALEQEVKEGKEAIKQNQELKKIIGEKELEIQILRDLLKKTNVPLPPRLK
jgi:transposase-like protein